MLQRLAHVPVAGLGGEPRRVPCRLGEWLLGRAPLEDAQQQLCLLYTSDAADE